MASDIPNCPFCGTTPDVSPSHPGEEIAYCPECDYALTLECWNRRTREPEREPDGYSTEMEVDRLKGGNPWFCEVYSHFDDARLLSAHDGTRVVPIYIGTPIPVQPQEAEGE